MLQDLVGKSVIVGVDEGGDVLDQPGLEFHGEIMEVRRFPYPPSVGRPGIYEDMKLRLSEPIDEPFKGCRLVVSLRHEQSSFEELMGDRDVIVNIQLYGPDNKRIAGAIGGVRLA